MRGGGSGDGDDGQGTAGPPPGEAKDPRFSESSGSPAEARLPQLPHLFADNRMMNRLVVGSNATAPREGIDPGRLPADSVRD
jgi:hypothetical protein